MNTTLFTPALVFSLLWASACAAAFSLWRGRGLGDLLAFWLAAVIGFGAGQLAGQWLDAVPWTIGQVHIIEGTLGALFCLVIVGWLRQGKKQPESDGD